VADGNAGAAPAGERPPPQPLGSSPRLRDGLTLDQATKAVGERRRAAAAGEGAQPAQNGVASTGNGHAAPGNGQAAPAEGSPDPIDRMLDQMRGGETAKPAAEGGDKPPQGREIPADGFELVLDGRPQRFTVEQLGNAVRMATDYTKKAQELSALTKTVNEKAQFIEEIAPLIIPEIQRRIQAMEGDETDTDWQQLLIDDPAEYHRRDALWKNAQIEKARLQKLQESQQQLTAEQTEKEMREGHQQLSAALPGWDDPQMRGRMQSEIIKWGRANKFPDAELSNVRQPRHVIALAKAMMFDRMMSRVSTETPRVPTVRQGFAPPEPGARGGVAATDAEAKFQARPTVNNALAAVLARRGQQQGRR
jgi:hypothetical protein